jgi:hypothetical protein
MTSIKFPSTKRRKRAGERDGGKAVNESFSNKAKTRIDSIKKEIDQGEIP